MSRSLSPDAAALATERAATVRRLVEATYGFRPSAHTARTFSAALQASLLETGTATAEELHELLLTPAGQAALDALAGRLTVGETHFFRVAPQIRMLRAVVLPALIGSRAERRRLRIWSAGCATGEEPYTLALLIRERARELAELGRPDHRHGRRSRRARGRPRWSVPRVVVPRNPVRNPRPLLHD